METKRKNCNTHAACTPGGVTGTRNATQATSHAAVTACATRPVIAARAWRLGLRSTSSPTRLSSPPPPPPTSPPPSPSPSPRCPSCSRSPSSRRLSCSRGQQLQHVGWRPLSLLLLPLRCRAAADVDAAIATAAAENGLPSNERDR